MNIFCKHGSVWSCDSFTLINNKAGLSDKSEEWPAGKNPDVFLLLPSFRRDSFLYLTSYLIINEWWWRWWWWCFIDELVRLLSALRHVSAPQLILTPRFQVSWFELNIRNICFFSPGIWLYDRKKTFLTYNLFATIFILKRYAGHFIKPHDPQLLFVWNRSKLYHCGDICAPLKGL